MVMIKAVVVCEAFRRVRIRYRPSSKGTLPYTGQLKENKLRFKKKKGIAETQWVYVTPGKGGITEDKETEYIKQ